MFRDVYRNTAPIRLRDGVPEVIRSPTSDTPTKSWHKTLVTSHPSNTPGTGLEVVVLTSIVQVAPGPVAATASIRYVSRNLDRWSVLEWSGMRLRIFSTRSLKRQKRAESPGNQAVPRRFRSRKLECRSWFALDLCVRLGSQRAKSRAKCSIYDAFFPVSPLPLAYLCRMLAISV